MQAQGIVRLLAASIMAAIAATGHAADLSTERTTMPDFCSSREVNCVLPDGAPRNRGLTFSGRAPSPASPVPHVPGNVPGATIDAAATGARGSSVEPNSRSGDGNGAGTGATAGWGSSPRMGGGSSPSQLRGSGIGNGGAAGTGRR